MATVVTSSSTATTAAILACEDLREVGQRVLEPVRGLLEADSAVFLQFRRDHAGLPAVGHGIYLGSRPSSLQDYAADFFAEDPLCRPMMAWSDRWHHSRDAVLCHLRREVPQSALHASRYFRRFLDPHRFGDVMAIALPMNVLGPQLLCIGVHRDAGRSAFSEIHGLALESIARPLRTTLRAACLQAMVEERDAALEVLTGEPEGPGYAIFDGAWRLLDASAPLDTVFGAEGPQASAALERIRDAARSLAPGDRRARTRVARLQLPGAGPAALAVTSVADEPRFVLTVRSGPARDQTSAQPYQLAATPVPLTAREQDVVRLVAAGARNREIAAELGISVRTVENHLRSVYEKLGVDSRARLLTRLYSACD